MDGERVGVSEAGVVAAGEVSRAAAVTVATGEVGAERCRGDDFCAGRHARRDDQREREGPYCNAMKEQ